MTGLLVAALSREDARDAAREELARQLYQDAQPPLLLRALGWIVQAFGDLVGSASGRVGGGLPGALGFAVLLLLVVAVVLVRLGPVRARRAGGRAVFDGDEPLTAQEHRSAAEAHAANGAYAEAVRERLRAIVRELEARAVLDPRPGRTAGEVARDAGAAVPALGDPLGRAALVFDQVWYGGRPADQAAYDVLVAVEQQVRATRLVTQ